MGLLITCYIHWERKRLFGATVEEQTRAWWHQVHKYGLHTLQITNVCLWSLEHGGLEWCKFSQNSEVASSAKWKNDALNMHKSSWFSGLGAGFSPWSHGFNPCCFHNFILLDKQSLLFFHPFELIIFCTVCCWQASSQQNKPRIKLWNVQKFHLPWSESIKPLSKPITISLLGSSKTLLDFMEM